ncbi:MAG: hypothetical protein AAF320_06160, partial [Myxococcota bacterium]
VFPLSCLFLGPVSIRRRDMSARCPYQKAYAPLLQQHMRQGFSLESFAGLCTSTQKLLPDASYAWVRMFPAFTKEPVSVSTVREWLQRHKSFRQAYEKGEAESVLFYEKRLLDGLDKHGALFVLKTRFSKVYGLQRGNEKEVHEEGEQGFRIQDINDPQELFRIARLGRRAFRGQGCCRRGEKHLPSK